VGEGRTGKKRSSDSQDEVFRRKGKKKSGRDSTIEFGGEKGKVNEKWACRERYYYNGPKNLLEKEEEGERIAVIHNGVIGTSRPPRTSVGCRQEVELKIKEKNGGNSLGISKDLEGEME